MTYFTHEMNQIMGLHHPEMAMPKFKMVALVSAAMEEADDVFPEIEVVVKWITDLFPYYKVFHDMYKWEFVNHVAWVLDTELCFRRERDVRSGLWAYEDGNKDILDVEEEFRKDIDELKQYVEHQVEMTDLAGRMYSMSSTG